MGLETRNATFETKVPLLQEWDPKHLSHSKFVSEENGIANDWAALTPFSSKEVYSGVTEVSIYIAFSFRGKKIGSELMENIIISSDRNRIWTLVSGVFPDNESTLKLNLKFDSGIIG
jgi:L-amino acid N-acyltransferase YncA